MFEAKAEAEAKALRPRPRPKIGLEPRLPKLAFILGTCKRDWLEERNEVNDWIGSNQDIKLLSSIPLLLLLVTHYRCIKVYSSAAHGQCYTD